jgi:hypothetical protein
MSEHETLTIRYFSSYSGVALPLNLVNPIDSIANRNTYFRASYREDGRLIACEKVVYDEVELHHRYHYAADGTLEMAEIIGDDGEPQIVRFTTR